MSVTGDSLPNHERQIEQPACHRAGLAKNQSMEISSLQEMQKKLESEVGNFLAGQRQNPKVCSALRGSLRDETIDVLQN